MRTSSSIGSHVARRFAPLARCRDDAVASTAIRLAFSRPAQQFERALARLKVILSVRGTLEGENGSYGVGGLHGYAQNFLDIFAELYTLVTSYYV